MSRIVNITKKKMAAVMMGMMMVVGISSIPVYATTITSDVYSTSAAGYTIYIRKSGSTAELGQMYLYKGSASVKNTFTASTDCGKTTVYVSSTTAGYEPKTATKLSKNTSVTAKKTVSKPSKVYGKCEVNY